MTTTAISSEHYPVMLPREDYPNSIGQTGCKCGWSPANPAVRGSMTSVAYNAHARKVGAVRAGYDIQPVYPAGHVSEWMTWDEARAAGVSA